MSKKIDKILELEEERKRLEEEKAQEEKLNRMLRLNNELLIKNINNIFSNFLDGLKKEAKQHGCIKQEIIDKHSVEIYSSEKGILTKLLKLKTQMTEIKTVCIATFVAIVGIVLRVWLK